MTYREALEIIVIMCEHGLSEDPESALDRIQDFAEGILEGDNEGD
jgi:hypothetical protein